MKEEKIKELEFFDHPAYGEWHEDYDTEDVVAPTCGTVPLNKSYTNADLCPTCLANGKWQFRTLIRPHGTPIDSGVYLPCKICQPEEYEI
jgi:hypothetical protein